MQVVCKFSNAFPNTHDHHEILPRHEVHGSRVRGAAQNLSHRQPHSRLYPDRHTAASLRLEQGREQGLAEGVQKGESRLAKLFETLFSLCRSQDAVRATQDPDYRKQLYKELEL